MKLGDVSQYFKDPAVAAWRKLLAVGAVAYTVIPFDAVPDVIPVLGWLDDLGVLGATVAFILRDVKRRSAARAALPPSR